MKICIMIYVLPYRQKVLVKQLDTDGNQFAVLRKFEGQPIIQCQLDCFLLIVGCVCFLPVSLSETLEYLKRHHSIDGNENMLSDDVLRKRVKIMKKII